MSTFASAISVANKVSIRPALIYSHDRYALIKNVVSASHRAGIRVPKQTSPSEVTRHYMEEALRRRAE